MLKKSLELDPGYADAYEALAVSYFLGSIWQFDKDPGVLDRAAESVEKAIALDDSQAGAYAVRGWIEGIKGQHDRAVADGKRAVSLDPNSAFAWIALADINDAECVFPAGISRPIGERANRRKCLRMPRRRSASIPVIRRNTPCRKVLLTMDWGGTRKRSMP